MPNPDRCPKCGYRRGRNEAAPAWQCPSCGIAYHKFAAYKARVEQRVAPRRPDLGLPPLLSDTSVGLLLAANLAAIITAIALDWRLTDLTGLYWGQSVIIGFGYYRRIMNLEKFSTANFRMNGRAVQPNAETKRKTAFFFLVHYGGFHAGYLFIIIHEGFVPTLGILACIVGFAVSHAYSYRYHLELDRRGTPNIGFLMFTPYARIIPMHAIIVLGIAAMPNATGLVLFGLLKTGADVVMHVIEHKVLARKHEASAQQRAATH